MEKRIRGSVQFRVTFENITFFSGDIMHAKGKIHFVSLRCFLKNRLKQFFSLSMHRPVEYHKVLSAESVYFHFWNFLYILSAFSILFDNRQKQSCLEG